MRSLFLYLFALYFSFVFLATHRMFELPSYLIRPLFISILHSIPFSFVQSPSANHPYIHTFTASTLIRSYSYYLSFPHKQLGVKHCGGL